ncbi:hypothetical protein LH460_09270 [Laribacter hongkongensis]|uniref:hypothetical protein n=1 Tax=Laribacter hongkongensis TaxID=168471 RepID=UPI001EFE5CCC|nr:hypothetical protein [Laribacter hongkongensis]MCG9124862.1 hypothetical protein [Laribacter hongkongensis]
MEPAYNTYDLDAFYKPGSTELNGKQAEMNLPKEMVQQMTAARFHEVAGKGPMPPFVKLAGLLGRHAWHIEAPYRPFKLHVAVWENDLCPLASSYDATLDLLDVLQEVLDCDAVMRSAVIREVVAAAPNLDDEQQRELAEYARAAGI